MPWTCASCNAETDDDAVTTCSGCGKAKTSWTINKAQTRRMRVGAKKFTCERGKATEAQDAPLPVAYDAATWEPTEVAPAMATSEARALAAAGQGPAPADVVRVAQQPGKSPPSEVELTVLPEQRKSELSTHPARAEMPYDARFLLVYGEPPGDLAFDGLVVVDVSDDRPEGHAPHIEVAALKRPPKRLAVEPRAAVDWSLFGFDLHHEPDWSLFGFHVAPEETAAPAEEEESSEPDWSVFAFDVDHAEETSDG